MASQNDVSQHNNLAIFPSTTTNLQLPCFKAFFYPPPPTPAQGSHPEEIIEHLILFSSEKCQHLFKTGNYTISEKYQLQEVAA